MTSAAFTALLSRLPKNGLKLSGNPHPRPQKTKRDKDIFRTLHLQAGSCVLSSNTCEGKIEIHHVLARSQGGDDELGDLLKLCSAHHLLITNNDIEARVDLGEYIRVNRKDIIAYIRGKLGIVSGDDWLRRRLFIGA